MRLSGFAVAALAAPALAAQDHDFFARKADMEHRSKLAKEAHIQNIASTSHSTSAQPKFLNSKTKKFAVKATDLPFIDFDFGESYSGLLPIDSTGRELFFWFFPTQGAGSKDITVWLNGGPGCSSLEGFFEENGPVIWQPGTYGPRPNPYSLNKLSNVVYVEQPVGTGFSQGKPNATNEVEVGEQFDGFWKNFVDLFGLQNYGIYLTGESYAGQYVPYIGQTFLQAGGTKYHDLKGILIYDPVVGPFQQILPAALPFAQYNSPSFPFDAATWKKLAQMQESCGFNEIMKKGLTFPPPGRLPAINTSRACDTYDLIYGKALSLNPCFNIYHVSETCPIAADILGGPYGPAYPSIPALRQAYFNRADVKKIIHAPDQPWHECQGGVLNHDRSPASGTRNGPIKFIAEKTGNAIVAHAKNDYILLSNATLLTLNNLVWNGKQGFDNPPNKQLIIPDALSGKAAKEYLSIGQWTGSRGLTFVEVDLSGHMVPQFNPRADFRIQEVLHGRVKSLSSQVPFTV